MRITKTELPDAPERLTIEARGVWDVVVAELDRRGELSEFQYDIIERYCYYVGACREIEVKLKGRELINTPKGKVMNPLTKVLNAYNQTMCSLAKQLGLGKQTAARTAGKKQQATASANSFLSSVREGFR